MHISVSLQISIYPWLGSVQVYTNTNEGNLLDWVLDHRVI